MTSGEVKTALRLLAVLSGSSGVLVIQGESILVELRAYPSTRLLGQDATLEGALRCALNPYADTEARAKLRQLGVVP